MSELTKPQADFLFSAMRDPRSAQAATAVVRRMRAAGFIEFDEPTLGWAPTRSGLEALAYYWMLKDARSGCVAYAKHRQEVEAALASRFPEPLKLAA